MSAFARENKDGAPSAGGMERRATVGFVYPFFEGIAWNDRFGIQTWLTEVFGVPFHGRRNARA